MTSSSAPPDPALWTWTDTFERVSLGPDYTTQSFEAPQPTITSGRVQCPFPASGVASTTWSSLSLSSARWNSRAPQIELDLTITADPPPNSVWREGSATAILNLTGDGGRTLSVSIQPSVVRLIWKGAWIAQGAAMTQTGRWRLTVDEARGTIQVLRNGEMVLEAPVPADYALQMGGAGVFSVRFERTVPEGGGTYTASTAALDNLAVRSGDGSAVGGTGTAGSSPRLGGEWRFASGPPDDLVGEDGDVWMNTAAGTLFQRQGGVYQPVGQLLAPEGPPGDEGPPGEPGPVGPAGPPADGALASNPILLGGATPAGGLILEVTDERGGLGGYVLLGQHGPPCTVEVSGNAGATWRAVTYPHLLAPGLLRLKRTDASAATTTIRALAPLAEGETPDPAPEPYVTEADASNYQSISNADATTDADGYQTLPDGTATTDTDGYQTVERS